MILCDSEIKAAIRHGQLSIDPAPDESHFATSAVNLTLDKEFRSWKVPPGGTKQTVDPSSRGFSYTVVANQWTELIKPAADGSIELAPGQFVLGITAQSVALPESSRLAARVEGRSSLARLGLVVHMTAPTIHSGFKGKITLEIKNLGTLTIVLRPGLQICQLIIEQLFGTPEAEMQGIFQNQTSTTGKSVSVPAPKASGPRTSKRG